LYVEEIGKDYFPKTFVIPEEFQEYQEFHNNHHKAVFLAKSSQGSQGKGIKFIFSPKDLKEDIAIDTRGCCVQQYVSNPLILDNKKSDLRMYVLISSLKPYTAFVNKEGLARFCTSDYAEPSKLNVKDEKAHLTNYSLNKYSKEYTFSSEIESDTSGSKRTLRSYFNVLPSNLRESEILEEIDKLLKHTLLAMYPVLADESKEHHYQNFFHVIGFDILLDEDGNPHLLEINANPSMDITFKYDQTILISAIDLHVKRG